MELKNIEAFLMVVEKGSFSIAAESMFITQPTISTRIQRLEHEIGATLFARNGGKKAVLTSFGETVYPFFKDGYSRIYEGTVLIHNQNQGKKIHLSCPNHMGQFVMPAILKELYQDYPSVEFMLKINTTPKIVEDVRNSEVDVGLIYLDAMETDKEMTFVPITNEKTILVAAPSHPLTRREGLAEMDLAEERMIIYARTFITTVIIDKFLNSNGLTEYKTSEIKNLEWLKIMVRNGLGIAFLQHNIVKEELHNGTLVALKLVHELPTTPISLIFRNSVSKEIRKTITQKAKELFMK